jgi:mannose-6-phosphate isomerase-like protein (cupin superfamily)
MSSNQMTAERDPAIKLAISTAADAKYVDGRRSFFKYRDLGVTDATNGRMRAQVTSADSGGLTEPTGWHYHTCEMQLVYMLEGWVELEFEDGRLMKFEAGDSVMIPGGAIHQETRTSEKLRLLEVSLPAEMGTVPCDPPGGAAN